VKELTLNFYQYQIYIESLEEDLIQSLRDDFSYFAKKENKSSDVLRIIVKKESLPKIPTGLIATSQSINSIKYQDRQNTYFDFYGKVLQIENLKEKSCNFYSLESERLYEVIYLYILSLSGKDLDLHHLHKIHAASVLVDDKILINMMPMKGGKSTWLLHMIKHFPQLKMISDDTPLVNFGAEVKVFPTRMALDLETLEKSGLEVKNVRSFKREQYGEKVLIDYADLNISVACNDELKNKKIILLDSHRISGELPTIRKMGKIKTMRALMRHMVIGVGLPIIAEYFVRFNFWDFIKLSVIFVFRLSASVRLAIKADAYEVGMCYKVDTNIEFLKSKLNLHINGS